MPSICRRAAASAAVGAWLLFGASVALAGVPSAPLGVAASPASSMALVSWSAPSSNGGSAITSYTVTPYAGSTAGTPVTVGGSARSATVTGLSNGTSCTFTVTASNSSGSGASSSPSNTVTPEDTVFNFSTPSRVDANDAHSLEVGVKFTSDVDGSVTGVRFYKSPANTGTHIGSLWTLGGQRLAQTTFSGESASGWQSVLFSSPVVVSAGTTYVASYFDPNGHYSYNGAAFSSAFDNLPLHAVSNGVSPNGVYAYGSSSSFPFNSNNAANYWVDVLFQPASSPGQVTGVSATALPNGASVSWSAPSSGGPATTYTVTPYVGSAAQPATKVTGAPAATSATVGGLTPGQSYTFVVQASNTAGAGPESSPSNAVTPTAVTVPSAPLGVAASPASSMALVSWSAPSSNGGSAITGYTVTPYAGSTAGTPVTVGGSARSATVTGLSNGTSCTFTVTASNAVGTGPASSPSGQVTPEYAIFDFASPQTLDSGDAGSLEVGVKFTADVNGLVTGIRFYKSAANTGTHIGSLWTLGGQRLAQTTFSGESASGWQTALFATPVGITAGTTYVASYFDPKGHYSATPTAFTTRVEHAPLHAPADSTSPNGVYKYGSTSAFPVYSHNAANYWVDPLFQPAASTPAAPGVPTSVSASPGEGGATVSWAAPWDGASPITSYTITPYVGSTAGSPTTVAGPATSATISGLADGTSYTFTVAATNSVGTGPASAQSNAVTPMAQPQGQWSPLQNWPLVAIHSALLKTGRVLTWDGWQQPQPTQEFDLSTQTFMNQINSPDDIFCSGMAELPDGRVIVVGGYGSATTGNLGIVDTNIYDPTTSTWTRVADMHYPRWYPALTELPDGRYVALSGKSVNLGTWADTPEVYDPKANTWTLLSGVSTSQIRDIEYPNDYVLPNGKLFVLGPAEDKSFLLDVGNQSWSQIGGSSGVVNGASIMYRPGQILYAGGAASLTTPSTANANAATIDMNAQTPAWRPIASTHYARAFGIMTMLADGTVLAIGGQPQTGDTNGSFQVSGGVLPSEIWDPSTGNWTTVAPLATTRGYHTSALLLPDGRVLVGGSGHANRGYPGQYSAQIYSPSYLFNGPRPTIGSVPATATYGSSITVSTPDAGSIGSVNLVDLGASTHQTDGDQRFVPLSFTQSQGSLTVQMPASGSWAPPGNYMLFIVNSRGVPSVASIINISAAQAAPSAQPARAVAFRSPALVADLLAAPVTHRAAGGGQSVRPGAILWRPQRGPAFIQRVTAYADTVRRIPVKLQANVTSGDRLVVEASIWGASAAHVTDSNGDRYTEVARKAAADGTEMSVWTAPVTAGGGTRPTITVTGGSVADMGVIALEYSGLSAAPGAAAIDRVASSAGTTRGPAKVGTGATKPASAPNELALGLYADSGFGDILHAERGWTPRASISPSVTTMEQVVEDRVVAAGSRPRAAVRTGSETPWLMATIVFRGRTAGADAAPTPRRLTLGPARSGPRRRPIPLSARRRPHPVAGAVRDMLVRTLGNKLVRFFCLVNTSGRTELSPLLAEGAGSWLK